MQNEKFRDTYPTRSVFVTVAIHFEYVVRNPRPGAVGESGAATRLTKLVTSARQPEYSAPVSTSTLKARYETHLDQLQLFLETPLLLVRLGLLRRLVLEKHHELLDVIAQYLNLASEAPRRNMRIISKLFV